jgi:hypothetical protein
MEIKVELLLYINLVKSFLDTSIQKRESRDSSEAMEMVIKVRTKFIRYVGAV